MRSVLIAGCGYLGEAAAKLFKEAEWLVEAWTKSAETAKQLSQKGYRARPIDFTRRNEVLACDRQFEVVIHSASTRGGDVDLYRQVYLDGAQNLLQHFPHATVLFAGSTSVYPQKNGEWVTEESPAKPEHERGRILREAEMLVLERRGIAARLAGIYGPDRSYLLQRFLAGEAIIDSAGDRFINQIHRDDAASALLMLATRRSEFAGNIFNVSDGQPIRQSECYRWLAQKLKRPLPAAMAPDSERKRGRSNKRVSNEKLRDTGWSPMFPTFADAMEKSILVGAIHPN